MQEVPTRFLADSQVPVELHAGDTLQACGDQIDGYNPRLATKRGTVHEAIRFHREVAATVAAAVRLRLSCLAFLDVVRSTFRAADAVRPTLLYEPFFSGFVVRKHAKKLS